MLNSGILDVAIGLVFIYLLLSLICSAISEMIEARLKMRATDLERGIRELLNDPKGTGLAQKLYNHPLVFGFFEGAYDPSKISDGRYPTGSNLPSYIPARTFALALMDIVLPAKVAAPSAPPSPSGAAGATASPSASPPSPSGGTTPPPLQPLRDAIGSIQNPPVEQALMTLVDAAGHDVSKARENIESWFDSTMTRMAGGYKRRVRWIVLGLGLIAAIAVNADTITIANSLSHDVAMRNSLVAAAQEYAKADNSAMKPPSPDKNSKISACAKDENAPECKVAKNLDQIQKLGLPVGWNWDDPRTVPKGFPAWLIKLLGWLLTATAVSLGAPFWFDVLNKFMAARSTAKPPETSPEAPKGGRG